MHRKNLFVHKLNWFVLLVMLCVMSNWSMKAAADNVAIELRILVPFRLMQLLHAPEVHTEIKLTDKQVVELEEFFALHDAEWFRSRLMPLEKQVVYLAELEAEVKKFLVANLSTEQAKRLAQLELQAQQMRLLLRSDIAEKLELTKVQIDQFTKLAKETDVTQAKLGQATNAGKPTTDLEAEHMQAAKSEKEMFKFLTPQQQSRLKQLLGDIFDTNSLQRIYPLAPELVPVKTWINSSPLTLEGLRGKVVVLHYYAFQCSNCVANFDLYRKWHDELASKGVVVLGIQSPETQTEKIASEVMNAAKSADLKFPILHDENMENWNTWGNTMWPTVYVIDKKGYLRTWWQGELRWKGATGDQTIEKLVDELLSEE
jgi:peroxiredoxin